MGGGNLKHLLSKDEHVILRALSSPVKIQDYLDLLAINFEPEGDTALSPRRVMRERRAHCIEGALLAALALWYHGERPYILDLVSSHRDVDHVVALFRVHGRWGAISKTNHAALRYRDPVYASVRELAMSYFHEYFLDDGKKTLRSYGGPLDLSNVRDLSWVTAETQLWHIVDWIDRQKHHDLIDRSMIARLRRADLTEREAGKLTEWKKPNKLK